MTLRVAVAGAGMVSGHHLAAWTARDDVDVVAIADPDPDAARARAEAFGVPRVFADAAEMLRETTPDALDVASPVDTHGDLIRAASDSGLAGVLCQKPLAADLARARAIADEAARHPGTWLMIHENWRFRPHHRRIADLSRAGRIGRPRLARMEALGASLLAGPDGRIPGLLRQSSLARMPRVIVLEVLVHHLDALRFLLGPIRPVHARLARLSPHVVGEDTALVGFEREDGLAGVLSASMARPGAPARGTDALDLIGEHGRITLGADAITLHAATPETIAVDHAADYDASHAGAIGHFVERLASGAPFETTPEVHLAALKAAEHVYALAGPRIEVTIPAREVAT